MSQLTVRAVIVHNRGREMLDRCLQHLLKSRGVELEVIVVANACHEPLPDVLRSDPRLAVVRSERSIGFAEANNLGVASPGPLEESVDYLFFVNNDAMVEDDTLIRLIEVAEEDANCAIVAPRIMIWGSGRYLNSLGINVTRDGEAWDEGIGRSLDEYGSLPQRAEALAVTGAALLVRASDFEELGGWSEIFAFYFEDIDLCLRAKEKGRSVLLEPQAVVWHAVSATAARGSDFKRQLSWRNRFILVLIHWPAALLWKIGPGLAWSEVALLARRLRHRATGDAKLQVRSWVGVLKRIPEIVRLRRRSGDDKRWVELLRPQGSVPKITLPPLPDEANLDSGAPEPAPDSGAVELQPHETRRVHGGRRKRRVLILGAAPLPFEKRQRQYAANLRTWHFAKPLLADGYQVRILAGRIKNTYSEADDREREITFEEEGLEYFSLREDAFEDDRLLQARMEEFEPDAIVGVNTYPSSRAVRLDTDLPIWCDLNGWIMAEAQTKTRVYSDNRYLSHFWGMEKAILRRADVISTVSKAQTFAVIGELATLSRLGNETFGYEFVVSIPNAVVELEAQHDRQVFRGKQVPEDAFVLLWLGGYNTWTDVDTLFDGLSRAMARSPELHFVSTGGAIEGHDERTFDSLLERVRSSEFAERMHFMGWVPTEDVPSYYFESDLGINIDGRNYETVFGARNRINEMMRFGLPVVTTLGTEISEVISERNLCLSCEIGDSRALAGRIAWAVENRRDLQEMGERAKTFMLEEYSYARTTEPLRAWLKHPVRAPDGGCAVELVDLDFYKQSPVHVRGTEVSQESESTGSEPAQGRSGWPGKLARWLKT